MKYSYMDTRCGQSAECCNVKTNRSYKHVYMLGTECAFPADW